MLATHPSSTGQPLQKARPNRQAGQPDPDAGR